MANGSTNNDAFTLESGHLTKKTNHSGGVLGGISDGSELIVRAAVKPTPSIARTQSTVNLDNEEIEISIKGRHDPIIVPRAVVVVESMSAICAAVWIPSKTFTRRRKMPNKLIDIVNVTKSFDENVILDHLNLYIRENEFLTLLGPSGCGKTTLLRILGGFETPDSGDIIFDGKNINKLPPNRRQLNTVFQKYALFTHMTIAENIAFGLKIKKKSKHYIDDKIKYALKLVNLEDFKDRYPDSLSGGQQQRIAIARAIVNEPKVLLLDEPLGALDLKLRQDMQYELIRLKNELGITFVYVTHDQEEALTMSDTIVVMNQGYIQQIGTPEDIYNEPQNAFVADFIGDSNILPATMVEDKVVKMLGATWQCVDVGFGRNKPVDAVIRPEDIDLVKPEEGIIEGVVTHLIFKGVHYEMEVLTNNYELLVHSTDMFPVGTEVGIRVDPFDIQIMKKPESEDAEAAGIEE